MGGRCQQTRENAVAIIDLQGQGVGSGERAHVQPEDELGLHLVDDGGGALLHLLLPLHMEQRQRPKALRSKNVTVALATRLMFTLDFHNSPSVA